MNDQGHFTARMSLFSAIPNFF